MSPYGALLKPPATPGDLYSGEKTTGYASGASGGSTPCRPSVMAAPALPWGRGGAAAPSERGGNYGQGRTVAHEPVLRVPRGAGTEAARATWRAGWGAWERPCRASGTMSGGPYGQGPDDVGEGPPRGHRRPRRAGRWEACPAAVRREPHRVAGMPPTGAWRQRPPARRGNAAVVTGPYGASLKPPVTPGDLYSPLYSSFQF